MRKVELFEVIRRDQARHGWGVRRLAKVHRVHRRLVRQALAAALPPERKLAVREAPVLGPAKPFIEMVLIADLEAPRKQRHTAHRIWQRIGESWGSRWRSQRCVSTSAVVSGRSLVQPR
jgi:hypothetical protein